MPHTLAQVALFQCLPTAGIERLRAAGHPRSFNTGEELLRQDQMGDTMHVITDGLVRVERWVAGHPSPVGLATLGAGEVVGELGLLDGEPRSATVRALEPTHTLELSATALALVALQYPEAATTLLNTLSHRVRNGHDLAERLLVTEEALRDSERRFRAVFQEAALGLALLGSDGRILEANPALVAMFGWTERDVVGQTLPGHLSGERDVQLHDLVATLGEGPLPGQRAVLCFPGGDGTLRRAQVTLSMVRSVTGEPRFAVALLDDVTEQTRERERREALPHIARRLAAEAEPAGLLGALLQETQRLLAGSAGAAGRWNPRTSSLEVVAKNGPEAIVAERGGQVRDALAVAIQTGKTVSEDARQPGSVESRHHVLAVPLTGVGGPLAGLALMRGNEQLPFTAEDAAMLELLASIAVAHLRGQERARLDGILLAARTMEHEINNELARTVGFAELLTRATGLSDEQRLFAQQALEGANLAAATVQQFHKLVRVSEHDWSGLSDSTIDLDGSTD